LAGLKLVAATTEPGPIPRPFWRALRLGGVLDDCEPVPLRQRRGARTDGDGPSGASVLGRLPLELDDLLAASDPARGQCLLRPCWWAPAWIWLATY